MLDESKQSDNIAADTASVRRGPGRPRGLPKPPGSGRQKGTPNRVTRDIRAAAAKHGPKALQALVKLLDDPDPKVKATAAREILDRAYGRPVTPTEITGADGAPLNPVPDVDDIALAQMIAFLAARAGAVERPVYSMAQAQRAGDPFAEHRADQARHVEQRREPETIPAADQTVDQWMADQRIQSGRNSPEQRGVDHCKTPAVITRRPA